MRIILSLLFSLICVYVSAQSDEQLLEKKLYDLPNVYFKKISEPGDTLLKYDLQIKQPVDHKDASKGFFYQHVLLLHKGFNKPTVLQNDGYFLFDYRDEAEQIFDANNINMEYRFFGASKPDSTPWQYLTIEQATADMHAINEMFRNIYNNKWISVGISKGGETSIYYKYFYPDDVDLTIPYVAPLDNSLEDKRIYHFFDTIGTEDCRNKLYQFQLFLLQHEKEALQKLEWYSKGAKLHYTYTGSIGKSFEYAVLEYPFTFWQYYGDCDSIPTNKSLDDYLTSLLKLVDLFPFADEGLKMFEAHYYQASTQAGYYGYNIEPYKKYLHYFTENPSASFPPRGVTLPPFDSSLNANVQGWLDEKGNNMIYIYGGLDTWTSAGVIVSDKVNSKRFVLPGATHSTARIKDMPAEMQQQFVQKVKEIIGLNINLAVLK